MEAARPFRSITPDTVYYTSSVTVDGNTTGALPQFTFNNVISFCTISVTFVVDPVIVYLNPVMKKKGTVKSFTITGTGCMPHGKTRVALHYPGTSTVFLEGESILVTSPGHQIGQFILPEVRHIDFMI